MVYGPMFTVQIQLRRLGPAFAMHSLMYVWSG